MSEQPLKKILNNSTAVVFFIGITTYIYILVLDYLEHKEKDTEEKVWIYSFLIILIIGFLSSFYNIEFPSNQ